MSVASVRLGALQVKGLEKKNVDIYFFFHTETSAFSPQYVMLCVCACACARVCTESLVPGESYETV